MLYVLSRMPGHFVNLLARSFRAIPTALGSTWLGLLFPLWGFLITQLVILLRDGWPAMKTHWKENLIRGFAVATIAWASLFAWCVVKTSYDDHQQLSRRVRELLNVVAGGARAQADALRAVREPLLSELNQTKQSCAEMKGANSALEKQTLAQQSTINNCQTQALKLLSPTPLNLTILYIPTEASHSDGQLTAKYILLTNQMITPVRAEFRCDRPIITGYASMLGSGAQLGGSSITPEQTLTIGIDSPVWAATSPMLLVVKVADGNAPNCTFTRRQ